MANKKEHNFDNEEIKILNKNSSPDSQSDSFFDNSQSFSSFSEDCSNTDFSDEPSSFEEAFSDEQYCSDTDYFSTDLDSCLYHSNNDSSGEFTYSDIEPINIHRLPYSPPGLSTDQINKFNRFFYKDIFTNTNKCVICCGCFEKEDSLIELSCYHLFHSLCLIPWLMESKVCPMCKKNLED